MEKDISIIAFIERLKQIINLDLLQVVDYWEADLCAFGLQKGNKLIYISTFAYEDKMVVMYDYDLELLDAKDQTNIHVLERGRSVCETKLIKKIRSFLIV